MVAFRRVQKEILFALDKKSSLVFVLKRDQLDLRNFALQSLERRNRAHHRIPGLGH